MADSYIDIISKIDGNQIRILNEYMFITLSQKQYTCHKNIILANLEEQKGIVVRTNRLTKYNNDKKLLAKIDKDIKSLWEKRIAKNFGLSEKQYDIYLNDLISKGLLAKITPIDSISPAMAVELTSLGEAFIDFIKSSDDLCTM